LSEAIEATKRAHVAVYTVGLLSVSGGQAAEDSLIRIAETSGGHAYFPNNEDEARMSMERVARDLREQYTLGYFPTNSARNGAWRSIRVDVVPPRGLLATKLTANDRHGYYGPGDSN
jgi:Ca-activated chloride channel family protein